MLTRRAALAAGLFTTVPLPARAASGPVAIIGAGAAGLAAAEMVRRAGHPFVLLEARNRIGGRAHTDRSLGPEASFDAGAQYIHWAERNPWSAIARENGVKLSDQDGWARNLFIDGRPATEAERNRRRAGFAGLDSLIAPKGRMRPWPMRFASLPRRSKRPCRASADCPWARILPGLRCGLRPALVGERPLGGRVWRPRGPALRASPGAAELRFSVSIGRGRAYACTFQTALSTRRRRSSPFRSAS